MNRKFVLLAGLLAAARLAAAFQTDPVFSSNMVLQQEKPIAFFGTGDRGTTVRAAAAIKKLFCERNMLCDTHTAVAVDVLEEYRKETGDTAPCVIASTASAYKFAPAVLPAIYNGPVPDDGFGIIRKLSQVTGTPVPPPLAGLDTRPVRHKSCIEKDAMADFIAEKLFK